MKLGYIGIDQYNNHYYLDKHPRKELLKHLNASSAQKMYVDTKGGASKHVGYIISGLWIKIYELNEWGSK